MTTGKDNTRSLQWTSRISSGKHGTTHRPHLFPCLQNDPLRHLSVGRTAADNRRCQRATCGSAQRRAAPSTSPAVDRCPPSSRQSFQHDDDVARRRQHVRCLRTARRRSASGRHRLRVRVNRATSHGRRAVRPRRVQRSSRRQCVRQLHHLLPRRPQISPPPWTSTDRLSSTDGHRQRGSGRRLGCRNPSCRRRIGV